MDTDMETGSNKTKIEVIIAVVVIALIGSVLVFFLQKNSPNTATQNTQSQTPGSANIVQPTGVLVNQNENNRIESNFEKVVKKNPRITPEPTTQYNFEYEVDPNLYKKQSLLPFGQVLAADTKCDLTSVPSTGKLYVLTSHVSVDDATTMAIKNGITAAVSAIPGDSGTVTYIFTNPAISTNYFTVSEPSALTLYHQAIVTLGEPQSMDTALASANKRLTELSLFNNLIALEPTVNDGEEKNHYSFRWEGNWGSTDIIDLVAIKSIGTNSVCDLPKSETINYLQVQVASDGTSISNIENNIRSSEKTVTVPIQSLTDSIKESASKPILDPEVFSTANAPTTGTVTIDEATIKFLDPGSTVGLSCYFPVYVTSGTVSGTRVVSTFPAIALKDITTYCFKGTGSPSGGDLGSIFRPDIAAGTLNYSTFTLAEPTLPPPSGTGTCWGNLVDYSVSCKDSKGTSVCSGFFSVKPEEDPFDTCSQSCYKPIDDKAFTYTAGNDVCKTFSEEVFATKGKPLPSTFKSTIKKSTSKSTTTYPKYTPKSGKAAPVPKSQNVVCSFRTCPC